MSGYKSILPGGRRKCRAIQGTNQYNCAPITFVTTTTYRVCSKKIKVLQTCRQIHFQPISGTCH